MAAAIVNPPACLANAISRRPIRPAAPGMAMLVMCARIYSPGEKGRHELRDHRAASRCGGHSRRPGRLESQAQGLKAVMKRRISRSRAMKFALCLRNDGNPASLEVFKVYRVV